MSVILGQKGEKMKIDRLISIVVYLLNHGRTSAQKLAEEFEVSSRTIMRDLDSLDQAGIPKNALSIFLIQTAMMK